jgi:hypothetical protein
MLKVSFDIPNDDLDMSDVLDCVQGLVAGEFGRSKGEEEDIEQSVCVQYVKEG